jgi:hypothetical protein
MTHSHEQKRKKAEAMAEAKDHHNNASVAELRGGKDHEAHQVDDMRDGTNSQDMRMNGGIL